ncbi:MAG: hypothetical protein M1829_006725 [Trizodia sp. TS-e1964]|nr:MAG: hypothetical protein M1829_006725 [Trizodia sp. TS-e1964]
MSSIFWAGYVGGAAGILVGNPLDVIKVRLQAGAHPPGGLVHQFNSPGALVKGVAAPLMVNGALGALLYMSYNRTLIALGDVPAKPSSLGKIWTAGAVSGVATWAVSAPAELVKCRAQMYEGHNSWSIAREIFRKDGIKGLYFGGVVTSLRDSIGYGF